MHSACECDKARLALFEEQFFVFYFFDPVCFSGYLAIHPSSSTNHLLCFFFSSLSRQVVRICVTLLIVSFLRRFAAQSQLTSFQSPPCNAGPTTQLPSQVTIISCPFPRLNRW